MTVSPISGSSSYLADAAQESHKTSSHPRASAQHSPVETSKKNDPVHLPQDLKVKQMSLQGESPTTIASTTGLTLTEVDGDLGILATSSSTSGTAVSAVGAASSAASGSHTSSVAASNAPGHATVSAQKISVKA